TAFLAVGSKAAGFAILLRFFHFAVGATSPTAMPGGLPLLVFVMLLCFLTMTLGNLAAISQTNMKRLLAHSSITHAGYALLAAAVFRQDGVRAALLYLAIYYVMNLGAFWVVMLVANTTGREDVEAYRGLAWRGGAVPAVALAIFLFSLMGLPPFAGFIGKFSVFWAGVSAGLIALVVAGVLNSVVSAYYYARVVKAMFLDEPRAGEPALRFAGFGASAVVGLAAM